MALSEERFAFLRISHVDKKAMLYFLPAKEDAAVMLIERVFLLCPGMCTASRYVPGSSLVSPLHAHK